MGQHIRVAAHATTLKPFLLTSSWFAGCQLLFAKLHTNSRGMAAELWKQTTQNLKILISIYGCTKVDTYWNINRSSFDISHSGVLRERQRKLCQYNEGNNLFFINTWRQENHKLWSWIYCFYISFFASSLLKTMLFKASGKREHGQGHKGGTLKIKFKAVENDLCAARHQKMICSPLVFKCHLWRLLWAMIHYILLLFRYSIIEDFRCRRPLSAWKYIWSLLFFPTCRQGPV